MFQLINDFSSPKGGTSKKVEHNNDLFQCNDWADGKGGTVPVDFSHFCDFWAVLFDLN